MKKTAATGLIIVMLAICGLVSSGRGHGQQGTNVLKGRVLQTQPLSTREGGPVFDEAISRPVTLARTAVLTEAISRAVTLGRPSELNEAISRAFTITVSPCPWDLDGNGVVEAADVSILVAVFGSTDPAGDVNLDGVVNVLDLIQLLLAFGQTCP